MVTFTGVGANRINQIFGKRSVEDVKNLPQVDTDTRSASGMISGKELMDKMRKLPKSNSMLGFLKLRTHSKEYKQAVAGLVRFHDNFRRFDTEKSFKHEVLKSSRGHLKTVIEQAQAYINKHSGNEKKAGRRNVMEEVLRSAQAELKTIESLMNITGTGGQLSLDETRLLASAGVTNFTQYNSKLKDGAGKGDIGSGALNTVTLVEYEVDGGRTEERVLKPLSNQRSWLSNPENGIGLDKDDLRFAARNFASSSVASQLGMSGLIPKSDVVMHQGVPCLAMQKAEGQEFAGWTMKPITQGTKDRYEIYERDSNNPNIPEKYRKLAQENLRDYTQEMGIVRNENGDLMQRTAAYPKWPIFDENNPKLAANFQKQFLDLQVLDMLCGQGDRNVHNFFFKIDGDNVKLTGIDNDTSFGPLPRDIVATDETYPKPPFAGLPLMSLDAYNGLQNIGKDKELYRENLKESGLSETEVGAAMNRLDQVLEMAEKMKSEGRVVEDFTKWTGKLQDKNGEVKIVGVKDFVLNHPEKSYLKENYELIEGQHGAGDTPLELDKDKHGVLN